MLAVIATLTVQADKAAAFEAAFRSLAQAVKASEPVDRRRSGTPVDPILKT